MFRAAQPGGVLTSDVTYDSLTPKGHIRIRNGFCLGGI